MTWYNSLSRAFRTASIPSTYRGTDTLSKNGCRYLIVLNNSHPLNTYLEVFLNLDSYSEDLHNIVGGGPDWVNVLLAKDSHKTDTVCLENPFLQSFKLSLLCDDGLFLVLGLRKMHVHLQDESRVNNRACD